MRFGIGMNTDHTLEEVGQQFSVTRERIRQIEAKALPQAEASQPLADAQKLPRSGLIDRHRLQKGRGIQTPALFLLIRLAPTQNHTCP